MSPLSSVLPLVAAVLLLVLEGLLLSFMPLPTSEIPDSSTSSSSGVGKVTPATSLAQFWHRGNVVGRRRYLRARHGTHDTFKQCIRSRNKCNHTIL
jgi:hypothetical protein